MSQLVGNACIIFWVIDNINVKNPKIFNNFFTNLIRQLDFQKRNFNWAITVYQIWPAAYNITIFLHFICTIYDDFPDIGRLQWIFQKWLLQLADEKLKELFEIFMFNNLKSVKYVISNMNLSFIWSFCRELFNLSFS